MPTSAADVLAGYWLARATMQQSTEPLCLLALTLGSCAIYAAGMITNDWFDLDVDRRERPFRPLPSGAIGLAAARNAAILLSIGGCVAAGWASSAAGIVAASIVVAAVAYDGWLKASLPAGAICMGLCRALNFLLGALGGMHGHAGASTSNIADANLGSFALLAATNGMYILAVTWFARQEASMSDRRALTGAAVVLGIAVLAHHAALFWQFATPDGNDPSYWTTVLLLVWLARWIVPAVREPTPAKVQRAVKWCILSLVLLNAQCPLAPGWPWHAAAIACLLLPCVLIGRWLYST